MALDIVWAGERCVVGVGVYRESIGIYEGENERLGRAQSLEHLYRRV